MRARRRDGLVAPTSLRCGWGELETDRTPTSQKRPITPRRGDRSRQPPARRPLPRPFGDRSPRPPTRSEILRRRDCTASPRHSSLGAEGPAWRAAAPAPPDPQASAAISGLMQEAWPQADSLTRPNARGPGGGRAPVTWHPRSGGLPSRPRWPPRARYDVAAGTEI